MTATRMPAAVARLFGTSIAGKILGASALVAVLSAVARLAAVARDLILAAQFGLGATLDAFFIALMIYQFVIGVFLFAFTGAFMPTYLRARARGDAPANELLRGISTLGLGLLGVVTLVVALGAWLYLPLLASGFDAGQLRLTREIVWLLAPFLLFSGGVTLWGAVINAGQRFVLPALTPALNAGLSVAVLLLFGRQYGVLALAAGMALGALAEAALLGVALRRQGVPLLPGWPGFGPELRAIAGQYGAALAAAAAMALTAVVDQAMATWLGPSAVSAFALGGKVVAFVVMLAAGSLATAAMPYASALVVEGRADQVPALARRMLFWVMAGTLPVVALLILLAEPITALVYQRGAFSADDTAFVAQVHAAAALQIPFYAMNGLMVRLHAALDGNRVILQGTLLSLAVNIAGNLVFMQLWGVVGIMLATAVVHVVLFAFLWWRLGAVVHNRRAPAPAAAPGNDGDNR